MMVRSMKAHFPFREIRLSNRFFEAPVYNTQIELTFYQAQDKVLEYARGILEHGLEPGILMIDDGWSPYYGKWEFRRDNFPDPEAMLRELHDMEVRKQYLPQILEAVDCARKTGEPIVRHMEYVFPGQGMECLMDQFMIGDKLLAAPVDEKSVTQRKVRLPKGMWKLGDRVIDSKGEDILLEQKDGPLVLERCE